MGNEHPDYYLGVTTDEDYSLGFPVENDYGIFVTIPVHFETEKTDGHTSIKAMFSTTDSSLIDPMIDQIEQYCYMNYPDPYELTIEGPLKK